MTVIADVTVPADQFDLGRLLEAYPNVELELERLVPLRTSIIPLFWVDGGSVEEVTATLRAEGTGDEWQFRLHFPRREDLGTFHDRCGENGVRVDVRRVYNPSIPSPDESVTAAQSELLLKAYERGYWNVPRGVELRELADEFDISTNAASQRLRRGVKTLVGEAMLPNHGTDADG